MSDMPTPPAATHTMGVSTIAMLLGWPLVVVGVAAQWLDRRTESAVEAALAERPMIAVIDEAAFVRDQPRTGNDDHDIKAALERARKASAQLTEAGFIVLDRSAVYSAPSNIHVPTSTTPANE